MPPVVSVIIPTYNRSALLAEAIESALAQTWKDLEIIVVDDGSTDDTQEVLAPYCGRIKYIYQPNSGVPSCPRNAGIRNATGEYIAILDSDDVMFPRKLEMQVALFEKHTDVGMVCSDFSKSADGRIVCESFISSGHSRFMKLPKKQVGPNQYILNRGVCDCLALDNFIGTSSVVARRDVFESVGLFDESPEIRSVEDIDMWFRIAERFPFGYIDLPLHMYRLHQGNISSMKESVIRARIIARERFFRSGAISSKTRRQLTRRLGRMYRALAYRQMSEAEDGAAALSLWESIKRHPLQVLAYKLLCAILIPKMARQPLRRAIVGAKNGPPSAGKQKGDIAPRANRQRMSELGPLT
jgi:glycosyltransferase involved in cell wall biosynthesis